MTWSSDAAEPYHSAVCTVNMCHSVICKVLRPAHTALLNITEIFIHYYIFTKRSFNSSTNIASMFVYMWQDKHQVTLQC